MTGALDSLEKLGHTIRRPHPSDRRMVAISLTPSGRAFLDQHLPERYRKTHELTGYLSKSERQCMLRVYAKVLRFLTPDRMEGRK